jgi:UDP-glucose 4-epimerase
MQNAVLVTGGAGYVGSHTTRRLLESGRNVVVLDNLSTGHIEVVRLYERLYGPEQFAFEQVGLEEGDAVASVFDRHAIDGVIDFAAKSLVGEGQELPQAYFDTNVIGFLNLVSHADGLPVVKSSTSATYGEPSESDLPLSESYQDDVVDEGRFDESQLMPAAVSFESLIERYVIDVAERSSYGLTERDIQKLMIPTNVYGITKMMDEFILQKRHEKTGAGFACLRYFNVAGADPSGLIGEDHDPETHLIPIVLQVALGIRKGITIFGDDYPTRDGTAIRDYVSVVDLAGAHITCLDALCKAPDAITLNLGTHSGYTVKEIVQSVKRVTGREITCEIGARRSGDPAMLVARTEGALSRLGWQAKETLDETIGNAWRWHRHNRQGYGDLHEERYNPFVGRWVTMSVGRGGRPWSGSVEDRATESGTAYDAECYLCPGNIRANGNVNPAYDSTFVFENDFPSLRGAPPPPGMGLKVPSPYGARPAAGHCEVLVYSPDHSKRMSTMSPEEIAPIVDCWADMYARLGARDDVAYVLIFENRGAVMGNSQLHPHGQVYAYSAMPDRMVTGQIAAFKDGNFVASVLDFEVEDGRRIVWSDDHFVAFVPYAAVMPYDIVVVSRRPVASIEACTTHERFSLSRALSDLLRGLDRLFDEPYHYTLALLQAPTDGSCPSYHFQVHLTSLLRGPGIRKHVVGSDIFGRHINPSDPTISAEEIRQAVRRALKSETLPV